MLPQLWAGPCDPAGSYAGCAVLGDWFPGLTVAQQQEETSGMNFAIWQGSRALLRPLPDTVPLPSRTKKSS